MQLFAVSIPLNSGGSGDYGTICSTEVGTEMVPSKRAIENDEGTMSRTEFGLSRGQLSRGPGAEEPLEETVTVDMFTPRVGAFASESRDGTSSQNRSQTPVVREPGIDSHRVWASTPIGYGYVFQIACPCTGKVSDPESLSFYVGFDTPG